MQAALQVFVFVKYGTVPHMPAPAVSGQAQAVELEPSNSPDLEGLTPAERQSVYDAVVQEMIRVSPP